MTCLAIFKGYKWVSHSFGCYRWMVTGGRRWRWLVTSGDSQCFKRQRVTTPGDGMRVVER
ncbi:hypothetical protein LINGRAHAP2_LOCUS22147 [Linum grandiflorum]